jgi:two-component system nitrogen regulation response regulator GlnG
MTTGHHPATRVLVVDDEESICAVLARTIAPLGFAVDIALDADAALESLRTHPAQVALIDIRMPGHNGVWLIERMETDYPSTAIIIVTGIRDLDARVTLRPAVVGYLTKPFKPATVRDMVTRAVDLVNALPSGAPIRGTLEPVSDDDIAGLSDLDEDHGEKES